MPTFTPKQEAALKRASPAEKKGLRKLYLEQKSAAQPKARTKPTANAPRAGPLQRQKTQMIPNYLDPMCKAPMPASLSDGRALAHTSLISKDFKLPKYEATGSPAKFPGPSILLVSNTGACSTVGVLVSTVENPGGTKMYLEDGIKQVLFNIPTLSGNLESGHPTAGRAMKFSATVINNTNALKRGGRVTHLNTFQRLPELFVGGTEADPTYYWDDVIEAVKAAPDRRRINADNLVEPKQCIGAIVDNISYHEFRRWAGTEGKNSFLNHVLDTDEGDDARPMSTVAFVFDPTEDMQDYSITIRASFYTRWPLTSVPGQSMSPMPTADTKVLNTVHEHNANAAGDLVKVGAAGIIGAKAGSLIPTIANRFAGPRVPGAGPVADRIAQLEAAAGEAAAEMVPLIGGAAAAVP